jgi:hypothetical protein
MKKTLLATMFAGLFSLTAFAANETKMVKIEVKGDKHTSMSVNVENDGDMQMFSFNDEELKDLDGISESLSDLDEKTRTLVLDALKGIHLDDGILLNLDGEALSQELDKIFIVRDSKHLAGHDSAQVIEFDEHGEHHRLLEFATKAHKMFKVKRGAAHTDPAHATKAIESLLKNNELTAQQLDAIQSMLDQKR